MADNESIDLDLEIEQIDDEDIDLVIDNISDESLSVIVENVAPGADYITAFKKFMAIYARNLSEVEVDAQEAATVSAGTKALSAEVQTALSEIDQIMESSNLSRWSRLNRPNLLNQRFWETVPMPTSEVIVDVHTVPAEDATAAAQTITYTITDEAITASYQVLNKISSNYTAVPSGLVTVTFAAGVATVTIAAREVHEGPVNITIRICTLANALMPYGENSKYWASSCPYIDSISTPTYRGDDTTDLITTSVVELTGNDVIEDADGEIYDHAIQYGITANSAYGNTEKLIYSCGNTGAGEYEAGQNPRSVFGEVPMEVGRTYTLSCWARVTSGNGAVVKFGWGGAVNASGNWDGSAAPKGESDFVEVSGSTWQRIHWTFVFNPTGPQFTDTQSGDIITRVCNWRKRVAFMVGRKYTATLQLCGFRLVAGNLEINTRYDELKEMILALEERVAALEG